MSFETGPNLPNETVDGSQNESKAYERQRDHPARSSYASTEVNYDTLKDQKKQNNALK